MSRLTPLALAACISLGLASDLAGQSPPPTPKKKGVKGMIAKLADTALTTAAAAGVDTLLGAKGRSVAGIACPPGTVAIAVTAGGQVGAVPTTGSMVVATAKKAFAKPTDSVSAASAQSTVTCQPADAAAMAGAVPAAEAGTPGTVPPQAPSMNPMSTMAAATPLGAAVVAAPMAGKAAKAVGGLFNKPQNKAAMIKDLVKGRLELKGVRFIEGSDELEPGYEEAVSTLAESLQAIEGTFVFNVPAEAVKGAAPDTVMARRRLAKIWAHLLVAGVTEARIVGSGVFPPGLESGAKAPKPGEGRVELVKVPADWKP